MKKKVFLSLIGTALLSAGLILRSTLPADFILSPLSQNSLPIPAPSPYQTYSFSALAQRKYPGSKIKLEKVVKKEKQYTSWLFSYYSDGKRVTGLANFPRKKGKRPVVIMLRGYADKEVYFTGLGTRKAAGVLAENGFLTLAPDFLGFGGSDPESGDLLEARFTRPITVLNLIAALSSLPQADQENIFLWGHSNGGQIALSVLEISQKPYPTTLWAPQTVPFPRSVLQYLDPKETSPESEKVIRAIERLKKEDQPENYSITNPLYLQRITAPIQIHQGGKDPWVKAADQEKFIDKAKKEGVKINYYFYPSANHNLQPNWDEVVQKDILFFTQNSVSRRRQ